MMQQLHPQIPEPIPPRFGDVLRRSSVGPIDHYGVYLGYWNGVPDAVLDIQKQPPYDRATVRVVGFTEFALAKPVFIASRLAPGARAADVRGRVLRLLAEGTIRYSLLGDEGRSWNCEHVAWWVAHGAPRSSQAEAGKAVLVGAVIGLALVALSSEA